METAHDGEELRRLRVARLALDEIIDAIIVHRPDGTVVDFNRAAAQFLGMTEEEFSHLGPWGWTVALADVREARIAELRKIGRLRFGSETTDGTRRISTEVHARWVDSGDGPLVISVIHDVTEKLRVEESLRDLAFSDPLTGVSNRALLDERLKGAMASARRHGDLLGVAFIDIDDFKPVNDEFGHKVGDRVLCEIARRLRSSVRDEDTVARVGGDEFVVVFPRVRTREDLEAAGAKLAATVGEPIELDDGRVALSASVGLSVFDPSFDDHHSIVSRADLAMYEAKRAGLKVTRLKQ